MQNRKIANLPEQIKIGNIISTSLVQNGTKRYSTLLYGGGKGQVMFQTPLFEKAMEIEHYTDYGDYYYVIPNDAEGNKMIEFISELEKHVIQILFMNKEKWFPNVDNVTFRSLIKSYKNEENVECKVIKFKIPYTTKTNVMHVDTIENIDLSIGNRERISVKEIEDGFVRMIVNVNAIWLTDNMFGIYMRPINIEEIRPTIQECDSDFEFQNTPVNNETISKTMRSVSHYIESEIKDTNNVQKKHIGRKINNNIQSATMDSITAEKRSYLPKYKASKQSKSSKNNSTVEMGFELSDIESSDCD